MHIALVKPDMGTMIEGYGINDGRMEPLSLGILAAMTPAGHRVSLVDERREAVDAAGGYGLAGITVDTCTARRAYALADAFRNRGVPVVLGGVHASLLPDEAEEHADAVIVGDAEPVWKDVVDDAAAGSLKPRYRGAFTVPQQGVVPRRELFRGKGYLPVSLIQYSRGCPFSCSYCSVSRFFGNSHMFRDVGDVVDEIRRFRLKRLLFVDDNITADADRAKELFAALIPLKVRWASQASIDMVKDSELMRLMARSGCIGQLVGFESINRESLQWLNKRTNMRDFDHYRNAIAVMRSYGFQTWASFIAGNDQDTPESIRKTVDFAIASKFTLAFFHLFTPYPGTAIYDQFRDEGRLLYDGRWWLSPDFRYNHAAFRPRLMGPDELGAAVVEANRRFYSLSSIGRRLLDVKTNLKSPFSALFYLRYNQVLRSTST